MALSSILLAVGEGDKHRLDEIAGAAIDIAKPAGATVELAHVFHRDEYQQAKRNLAFEDQSEVTPATVAERYVTIQDLGNSLEEAGVDYGVHGSISNGVARSERIIELAETVGADMIIVGGRKRTPAGKAVFGSTAQEVLLNASCPVTFVSGE